MHRLILAFYGIYSVTCLAFVAGGAALLLVFPSKLETRRNITRGAARAWFRLSGVKLTVTGQENLASLPAVVVANHASYIDGIVMHAVLPSNFAFVIKREVTSVPGLHFLLRRIGSHFVERKNRFRGGKDAKTILQTAASGQSIAIFPEGTFTEKPGLARFRTGAFTAAVAAGTPVIPAVISGSRQLLSADDWLPKPGNLHIRILEPIASADLGEGREAMRHLATLSRNAILEHLDEPDLLRQATS